MPSHDLNQCWNIVNWTFRNKLQWTLNWNLYIFIKKNALENVTCKMAAILCRPQCVKAQAWRNNYINNFMLIQWLIHAMNIILLRIRHFQMGFLQWKYTNINRNFIEVPRVLINNIPALVQIMAWHRAGDKPLSEPMMVSLLMHICVARPQWVKLDILHAMLTVSGSILS